MLSTLILSLGAFSSVAATQPCVEPSGAGFWRGAVAVVAASAALDRPLQRFAEDHQSTTLDRMADATDPLGRARYLLPALAASYLISRVANRHDVSSAVVRVGAGYLAGDAIVAVLKPAIGRHRPDSLMRPWRVRPFSTGGEWHSFPSGHTVHAFTIAAGVADEANRPWVTVAVYTTAAAVGAQRVYTSSHWASDVAASAVLAIAASKTTRSWLHRRSGSQAADSAVELRVLPGAVVVSIPMGRTVSDCG